MARYQKYEAGEDGWSDWVRPVERGYKLSCCDCGLVHTMDFRVDEDRAEFRVARNARATAAIRRERQKRGEGVPLFRVRAMLGNEMISETLHTTERGAADKVAYWLEQRPETASHCQLIDLRPLGELTNLGVYPWSEVEWSWVKK